MKFINKRGFFVFVFNQREKNLPQFLYSVFPISVSNWLNIPKNREWLYINVLNNKWYERKQLVSALKYACIKVLKKKLKKCATWSKEYVCMRNNVRNKDVKQNFISQRLFLSKSLYVESFLPCCSIYIEVFPLAKISLITASN